MDDLLRQLADPQLCDERRTELLRQQQELRAGDRLIADYREQTETIRTRIYVRILGGDP